jgi:hypothetical protein
MILQVFINLFQIDVYVIEENWKLFPQGSVPEDTCRTVAL